MRMRVLGVAVFAIVAAGCGLGSGSIDDFTSLGVGDCVEGNVLVEYAWDRIDCSEMDDMTLDQHKVTWVGTTSDADKLGFAGAAFSGDCPLPVEGDGVVVCFR